VIECIYCHELFDPPSPVTTFCRWCYFSGKTHEEALGPFLEALRAIHPVQIEHTGGGCFWVCARLENGHVVAFTVAYQDLETGEWEMDAVLPESCLGPWGACHYDSEDCETAIASKWPMDIEASAAFLRSCVEDPEATAFLRTISDAG